MEQGQCSKNYCIGVFAPPSDFMFGRGRSFHRWLCIFFSTIQIRRLFMVSCCWMLGLLVIILCGGIAQLKLWIRCISFSASFSLFWFNWRSVPRFNRIACHLKRIVLMCICECMYICVRAIKLRQANLS